MIPRCLQLDEDQEKALKTFIESLGPQNMDEIDCCGSSALTFHCFTSGIGDSLWVSAQGREFHLGYDDDSNIIGESNASIAVLLSQLSA